MTIHIECKEDVVKLFCEKLGYEKNTYYNYDKTMMDMDTIDEIKSMHLISDTEGFKVWLFEVDKIENKLMNRIANKLYNANPLEYNLWIGYTNLVCLVCTNDKLNETYMAILDYADAMKCVEQKTNSGSRRITVTRIGAEHDFYCYGVGFKEEDYIKFPIDYAHFLGLKKEKVINV